jgi:chromosome segregation protein
MFLKRLEINGFKSFAQKTVFEFPSGIVGVVGPNGSGKSNVIDAIRWLLGEREAKNLRGGKIEDLIFAGTAKKARMSMAQVSLVFDNSTGALPLDYKEVIITRRITRNGLSQYFINDAEVRLKDVIDFFAKIKLGTKGLTIIGQGAGDIFVKASPVERMMMVQEILGLREYQIKKAEAQRKLQTTRGNLEKIAAMIQEVGPRLKMLKRQTAKWEKRAQVQEELRSLEESFFSFKIHKLASEQQSIGQPLPKIEESLRSLAHEQSQVQQELARLENASSSSQRVQQLQKNKRDLFASRSAYEKDAYKMEAEIDRLEHMVRQKFISLEEAKETLMRIKTVLQDALKTESIGTIQERIHDAIETVEKLFAPQAADPQQEEAKRKMGEEIARIRELLKNIERDIEAIEKEEAAISQSVEEFNRNFKQVFTRLEGIRSQIKDLNDRKSRISFEQEKNAYKRDELRSYIASLGADYAACERIALSADFAASFSESELADIERKVLRLRGEIASIGEIDEALIKETQEVEAHYEHLTKESADLEQASSDLYALISELNQKISADFHTAFRKVNEEFNSYFRLMFGGGSSKMKIIQREPLAARVQEGEDAPEQEADAEDVERAPQASELFGIDIELSIPQKKITSLDMLSGGEKSLVSLAVLFALISVSPPPFLVLDEVDSALDEKNSKRFSDLIQNFSQHTQFIMVTHNRVIMEAADALYGVTMDEGGGSKVLSIKLVSESPSAPQNA